MKQPELGNKISETRIQKSLTQKELSDSSHVDIRTIQRIEAGEVLPRTSTIRLIAESLEVAISELNGNSVNNENKHSQNLLWVSFIAGIFYLINFIFYMPGIIVYDLQIKLQYYVALSIFHAITAIFLFNGFYIIGNSYKNKLMKIGALIIMITVPLMNLTQNLVDSSKFHPTESLLTLFAVILGINGVIFGMGLLKNKNNPTVLYTAAGILQIIISPLIIFPMHSVMVIGFWLTIPFIAVLVIIVFYETRRLR